MHDWLDLRRSNGVMTRKLRQEDGIALVMALGITVVLIIFVASMISFTSSSGRSSQLSAGDVQARQYADAGLNSAYSTLQKQLVTTGGNPAAANLLGCNGATGASDTNGPSNCSSPAAKVFCVTAGSGCSAGAAGSASVYGYYSGTNATTYNGVSVPASTWLLVATGYARNPNTSSTVAKTETAQVNITPLNNGSVAAVWNHLFLTAPLQAGVCGTTFGGNNMTITDPIYAIGNVCLTGQNTTIQEAAGGQPIDLMVGGKLVLSGSGTSAGTTTKSLTSGIVVGGCNTTGVANAGTTCNASTHYYVTGTDTFVPAEAPEMLSTDITSDYNNSDPGPKHACASGGLPSSTFDNDTTQNGTNASFELVPNSTYTCVSQSGASTGQMSWNNTTKTLTIAGNVFLDGNLTISQSAYYTGTGVIEAAGTITINGNGTSLCATSPCNTSAGSWQGNSSNTSMLTLVSLKSSTSSAIQFTNNSQTFQGSMWTQPSSGMTFVKNGVKVEGPMSIGSFDNSFNNATFIPLPVIKNMPVGAPLPPNTGASVGTMTVTK